MISLFTSVVVSVSAYWLKSNVRISVFLYFSIFANVPIWFRHQLGSATISCYCVHSRSFLCMFNFFCVFFHIVWLTVVCVNSSALSRFLLRSLPSLLSTICSFFAQQFFQPFSYSTPIAFTQLWKGECVFKHFLCLLMSQKEIICFRFQFHMHSYRPSPMLIHNPTHECHLNVPDTWSFHLNYYFSLLFLCFAFSIVFIIFFGLICVCEFWRHLSNVKTNFSEELSNTVHLQDLKTTKRLSQLNWLFDWNTFVFGPSITFLCVTTIHELDNQGLTIFYTFFSPCFLSFLCRFMFCFLIRFSITKTKCFAPSLDCNRVVCQFAVHFSEPHVCEEVVNTVYKISDVLWSIVHHTSFTKYNNPQHQTSRQQAEVIGFVLNGMFT